MTRKCFLHCLAHCEENASVTVTWIPFTKGQWYGTLMGSLVVIVVIVSSHRLSSKQSPCRWFETPRRHCNNVEDDSIYRCHLILRLQPYFGFVRTSLCNSTGDPIVEIRRSYDRLISTIGFPIMVRRHLYIESGSWLLGIVALGPLTEVYAPDVVEQKNYPNGILRPMAGTLRPAPWASTKHKTAMVGLGIDMIEPHMYITQWYHRRVYVKTTVMITGVLHA